MVTAQLRTTYYITIINAVSNCEFITKTMGICCHVITERIVAPPGSPQILGLFT